MLAAGFLSARAVQEEPGLLPDYDSRAGGAAVSHLPLPSEAVAALRGAGAITVSWNPITGTPQATYFRGRALASPPQSPSGAPDAVATSLAFLADNLSLLGWTEADLEGLSAETIVSAASWRIVEFERRVAGIEVFQGGLKVAVDAEGAVRGVFGFTPASLLSPRSPALSAFEAVRIAAAHAFPGLVADLTVIGGAGGASGDTLFAAGPFDCPVPARLVVFPIRPLPGAGNGRLAWRVVLKGRDHRRWYEVLVDAEDGTILHRFNLYRYVGPEGETIDTQSEHPLPIDATDAPSNYAVRPFPTASGSLNDWFDTTQQSLSGNNVRAWRRFIGNEGPVEPTQSFDYPFLSWHSSGTNLFNLVNFVHDHFHALGFDEPSKNFQQDNFGLGGAGGDPVQANARAAGRNNANFAVNGADGYAPETNFYFWDCESCPDLDGIPGNGGEIDGAYDAGVLVHEYTHGVSNRLVGAGGCVGGVQAGAMGEAWGDWYASSIYEHPVIGDYSKEGASFVRTALNDYTYGELCNVRGTGVCQIHRDGEIWYATLWDLRANLIAVMGREAGRGKAEQIVIDGMKLTPCQPTFLQARDAILQAEQNRYGGAHQGLLWQVFASRGMGASASTTGNNDTHPAEGFDVPPAYDCGSPSTPPASVGVSTVAPNVLRVSWSAVAGSGGYRIYRRSGSSAFTEIATVPAPATSYDDASVHGGVNYEYRVRSYRPLGLLCSSADSAPAIGVATGDCGLAPEFAGVASAEGAPAVGGDCGVSLSWAPASSACPAGPSIAYNVYRSESASFVPSVETLMASTTASSYRDEAVASGRTYWYVVRAEDSTSGHAGPAAGGNEDTNVSRRPAAPTAARSVIASWDFEASDDQGWTTSFDPPPSGGTANGFWERDAPNGTLNEGAPVAPGEDASSSGVKAWVTDNGAPGEFAGVSDIDNGPYRLISPPFDATGFDNVFVSYSRWWMSTGPSGDYFRVEVDNGVDPPVLFEELHNSRIPWTRVELALAGRVTFTSSMRLRFIAADRPNNSFAEAGIDDVRIEGAADCAGADLRVSGFTVDDALPQRGNGNGRADPGETIAIDIAFRNDGLAPARDVEARLVAAAGGVTILNDRVEAGEIPAHSTVTAPPPRLALLVARPYAGGASLPIDLEVAHDGGRPQTVHLEVPVGTSVSLMSTGFETSGGWTASGCDSDGTTRRGAWQRGAPVGTSDSDGPSNPAEDSPDPGSACYVTGNGGDGPSGEGAEYDDVDDCEALLVSPVFTAAGYDLVSLSFQSWFTNSEFTDSFLRVEISADGGASWARATDDFRDQSRLWRARSAELTQAVAPAPSMRLRFVAADMDTSTDGLVEAAVDDVLVVGHDLHTDAFTPPPGNRPNPIVSSLRAGSERGSDVRLVWSAPAVDASHDAPSEYRLYRSQSPGSGFALQRRIVDTSAVDDDALRSPSSFYYSIIGANAAGDSGDTPAP